MRQITEQMDGTWRERSRAELPSDPRPGPRILLEEWIDVWVRLLDEIEPTTRAKYKYGQPALDCRCPVLDGRADCKGDDETEPNYLFLGPKGGHPRRSNYAARYLTPAAEGSYPARNGTRRPVYVTTEPWPGIPIRKGNWKTRAADVADGTWPDLTGKFRPHDDRHTHATWLDAADLHKVIQMDRRGHAMPGMDAIYNHITLAMRQRLCDVPEQLLRDAVIQRYKLAPRSAVPLLNQILADHGKATSTR